MSIAFIRKKKLIVKREGGLPIWNALSELDIYYHAKANWLIIDKKETNKKKKKEESHAINFTVCMKGTRDY